MPLITCPDCRQEVSDQAVACPKCGYPVRSSAEQPRRHASGGLNSTPSLSELRTTLRTAISWIARNAMAEGGWDFVTQGVPDEQQLIGGSSYLVALTFKREVAPDNPPPPTEREMAKLLA